MRRIVLLCAALMLAGMASAHRAVGIEGSWSAQVEKAQPGKINVTLWNAHRSDRQGLPFDHSSLFDRAAFTGLSAADVDSKDPAPVRFALAREAGTVAFEGSFQNGHGTGSFTFAPSADYPKRLEALGVRLTPKPGDDDREMFELALIDLTTDSIRSMQAIGYREPLEKYVAFRIFDVDPAYVDEMAALGFGRLSADKLIASRVQGVTPEYIRKMRAAGDDLTLDQYIESRIFRVTPDFAEEMKRVGYANLDRGMLVQFRIHGVTPEFVKQLREMGYSRVPAQKLVEMRIHGVTPEFIRRVEKAGYDRVSVDELIRMRIFNVDPEHGKAVD